MQALAEAHFPAIIKFIDGVRALQIHCDRYAAIVRLDAPWSPSNVEFIRRITGLENDEAAKPVIFDASSLIMGLGGVYLGVCRGWVWATGLDPSPARTFRTCSKLRGQPINIG